MMQTTPHAILRDTRREYEKTLRSQRTAYTLSDRELDRAEGDLADLVSEAGYGSLRGYLNEHNRWGDEVGDIAADLVEQVAMSRAHEAGFQFDDLEGFLSVAGVSRSEAIRRARERVSDLFVFGDGYKHTTLDADLNAWRESNAAPYTSAAFSRSQSLVDIARAAQGLQPTSYEGGNWTDCV